MTILTLLDVDELLHHEVTGLVVFAISIDFQDYLFKEEMDLILENSLLLLIALLV